MNIITRCIPQILTNSSSSRLLTCKLSSQILTCSVERRRVMDTHYKARSEHYAGNSSVSRFQFEDQYVPWSSEYEQYKPILYTDPCILKKPLWADHDSSSEKDFQKIQFNKMDGNVNRVSYNGAYKIANGLPLNPIGRTGIQGRGKLGKWGPNHAADPIVTRWKRNDADGSIVHHETSAKPIVEFVCIQRRDNGEWALPGGMVDSGEHVSLTLKREFGEEAMNTLEEGEKESTKKLIDQLFKRGTEIYKGYVDDPRNTDNAWMETIAVNFHDNEGSAVGRIPLSAGDDAQAVKWQSIDGVLNLYASHSEFIHKTCEHLNAHSPF